VVATTVPAGPVEIELATSSSPVPSLIACTAPVSGSTKPAAPSIVANHTRPDQSGAMPTTPPHTSGQSLSIVGPAGIDESMLSFQRPDTR
jgi:hypothetical protein